MHFDYTYYVEVTQSVMTLPSSLMFYYRENYSTYGKSVSVTKFVLQFSAQCLFGTHFAPINI
jgi:hypothetical protein